MAAALLVLGGAMKAAAPSDTASALRGMGLPGAKVLVRVGGAAEAVIGVLALARGDRVAAALVALSYLAFAGFVTVALLQHAPIATCGCFGKADTPPSLVHLGLNVVAAAAAVAVVVDPGVSVSAVLADQPLGGIPFLVLVVTGVLLSFLALTLLPRNLALARGSRSR
jgi:hypothetical protein